MVKHAAKLRKNESKTKETYSFFAAFVLIFFPSLFHVYIQEPRRLVKVSPATDSTVPTFDTLSVFVFLPLLSYR